MKLPKPITQFIRFGIVGVSNTLITAIIIWVLLELLHFSDYLANIIGYVVGLTNSFIWNRKWTFASNAKAKDTILKFIITFAISYFFQLGNLYILLHYSGVDPYVCQLLSIGVYTCINFVLNKYYTFKTSGNEQIT